MYRRVKVTLAGCLFLLSPLMAAAPIDLYDWLGVAPIVVEARVLGAQGRFTEVVAMSVLRGEMQTGTRILVDVGEANAARPESQKPLRLEEGDEYLLLLQAAPPRNREHKPSYNLARGVDGARLLPGEGRLALLEAVRQLVAVQDRRDELQVWNALRTMLEDPNPILVQTALRHHLKYHRGAAELLPSLQILLDHPRPDVRAGSAELIGQILERSGSDSDAGPAGLLSTLYGCARRDPDPAVRAAATASLKSVEGHGSDEVLREIALQDADQSVRYEAEKILLDRRLRSKDAAR